MLENLVAWILNNYIGEYFCLNTDQLSIAFLQGQVDLENVPLRSSSLRKFDIPLQVKHGLIGKLQLQVPLTRIRSQPWILRIRDFLVVLGPYSSNYDVEIVEQYKQQNLERMLDELEIEQKKQLLAQLGIKFNENIEQTSWWGTTSLLSTISSNIQILLENVRIKYESSDFNFGVQIDSLHVQTTNSQWHVGFVEPTGTNIFKKIDIKGFSIYWNTENTCNNSPIVLPLSLESLKAFFSPSSDNVYILQPLTLELRMEKNSSPFPLRSTLLPRFKFNVRSQRIELELTQKQVSQIQQFLDDWSMFERARPHRKWRPHSSIITSPRRWWQFAINRQLEQIRRRTICKKSKELFERLHLLNTYCRAYRHRLNCFLSSQKNSSQNVSSLDPNKLNATNYSLEETTLLKQIEHDSNFSYSDLHILREAVFQKMLSELKQQHSSADINIVSRTESPFQIIESDKQEILLDDILKIQQTQEGVGWLNWMSNWFGHVDEKRNKDENTDLLLNDSVYLNNISTPELTTLRHPVSPELEEIEKRMQAEILQMLNDSLDDYNILRRDNLLAELILNFTRVHLRIATDKVNFQEDYKNDQQNINLLMLTFDLDQLCGRIHVSPKEHRTEMSINVGDLSIQLMKQQQFDLNEILKEEEKMSENGEKLYCSDYLKNNNNDESLFCGFQNNISSSDINTSLLFTIGRRSEKSVKNKNTNKTTINNSSPILELFYKRLAPKLEIYHELNICCAPLAMIIDDCFRSALQEIIGCVEQKTFNHTTLSASNSFSTFSNDLSSKKASIDSSLLLHQIFISLTVPELLIELRSQRASQDLILLTLPKSEELNNYFLQNNNKTSTPKNKGRIKRKRATNSVLFPLNFDITDIYVNNDDELSFSDTNENENNFNNKSEIKEEKNTETKTSTNIKTSQTPIKTTSTNTASETSKNTKTPTNKTSQTPTKTTTTSAAPFILANICGLSFNYIKKDLQQQKINKVDVGFNSICLYDLFEKQQTTNNNNNFVDETLLLLRIGKEKTDKNESDGRSLSCPDLTDGSKHVSFISSNTSPNKTTEILISPDSIDILPSTSKLENNQNRHQTMPTTTIKNNNNARKIKLNNKKKHSIEIQFIPQTNCFETQLKKANCIITGNFDNKTDTELFINRRTWLLLMDFFGFCSIGDINKNVLNSNYIMRIELNAYNLILLMNYPRSEFTPHLGKIFVQKPTFTAEIDLNIINEPILICMEAHNLSITDANSPFFQRFYIGKDEKLNAKSQPIINMKIVKNRHKNNADISSLSNEFDINLIFNVNGASVSYIHTQRYYTALLDFWLQFAQLYDRLFMENELYKKRMSCQKNLLQQQDSTTNLLKLRCKLDINFANCFQIYIPISENSPQALLFECAKVNISNRFCRAAQLIHLLSKYLGENLLRTQQFNILNETSSPLLDDITIKIQNFCVCYGNFCASKNTRNTNERLQKNYYSTSHFHALQFAIKSDNTHHDMEMQLYRNLSVRTSHSGGYFIIL